VTPPTALRAGSWARAGLGMALLAMAVFALRITERGEIWLDRTYWLVGLAGFGGLGGGLLALAVPRLVRLPRQRFWRLILTGMMFVAGFLAAMMLGYVLYTLGISGQFEPRPEYLFRAIIFASLQTCLLFIVSIPPYLLPWPLPLLIVCAGYLLAPRDPVAKPVEPVRPTV